MTKLLSSFYEPLIKVLTYYDIFNYPLRKDEIIANLPEKVKLDEFEGILENHLDRGLIFEYKGFYSLEASRSHVHRRIQGNKIAQQKLNLAKKISQLIYQFPFIRGVMLSGSISKGYMDESSDIDYFIITSPGRLWVARMLLVLFKRLAFFNSHKYFCVNYFIDSNHLEIEEKNQFTSIECATLIPTVSAVTYTYFLNANTWIKDYLPNFEARDKTKISNPKSTIFKYIMESLLNNRLGEFLDKYFMKLTYNRWSKKFGREFKKEDFEIAFKTNRHTSKNHPKFYQKKVLNQHKENLHEFRLRVETQLYHD